MNWLNNQISKKVSIAPLISFRIIFGALLFYSTIRFISNNWIQEFYLLPNFHFSFHGFEFIKPYGVYFIYSIYGLLIVSSIGVMIGAFFRLSSLLFFLAFTYTELIDKTYYLNHYYFVSLISFLLFISPAHKSFSIDSSYLFPKIKTSTISQWSLILIKFQLICVYFFAGIAKLNYDWIVNALPLRIWLPANEHLPIIGGLLSKEWVAYIFSYSGAIFDLFVGFLLLYSGTRIFGYLSVVVFHILTGIMFPIGVFPIVMIGSTLVFFSDDFHRKILRYIGYKEKQEIDIPRKNNVFIKPFIYTYILVQLALPFRYLLYSDNLYWTEQGYRFSWRVMLIEKVGKAQFFVKSDRHQGKLMIDNSDYLTSLQEKMMATQPDMILQYAHYLRDTYKDSIMEGIPISNPEIYVEAYVSLNGRKNQLFIDSSVNLSDVKKSWKSKDWITPFKNNPFYFE